MESATLAPGTQVVQPVVWAVWAAWAVWAVWGVCAVWAVCRTVSCCVWMLLSPVWRAKA